MMRRIDTRGSETFPVRVANSSDQTRTDDRNGSEDEIVPCRFALWGAIC